jgi:hypothetical protein
MSRRIKKNGSMQNVTLDKAKKYKYDAVGELIESTGTAGDNEIEISGSKSSLRRVADLERNISILATSMLTTDNDQGVDSPAQVKAYTDTQIASLPTPGISKFVASGALPDGSAVILNSDGTVSISGRSETVVLSVPASTDVLFADQTTFTDVAFDPHNVDQFVISYRDTMDSMHGKLVLGTISGTTITLGTPYTYYSGDVRYNSVKFDPNTPGSLVAVYRDPNNANSCTAIAGTIANGVISFGTSVTTTVEESRDLALAFDPHKAGQFLVTYYQYGGTNANNGYAVLGQISGNAITFGAEHVVTTQTAADTAVAFDHRVPGQFVMIFRDPQVSHHGKGVVGHISGDDITFGNTFTFYNQYGTLPKIAFDPHNANKFIVSYRASTDDSQNGQARVGYVSGTGVLLGDVHVFNAAGVRYQKLDFDPNVENRVVFSYTDYGNSLYGTFAVGTISDYEMTFETHVFHSVQTTYGNVAFDMHRPGRLVSVFQTSGNNGKVVLSQLDTTFNVSDLTSTNLIGITTSAYTDGQEASITIAGGISTNQSGLTTGSTYYAKPDGTVGLTAGSPKAVLGKAVSSTEIMVANSIKNTDVITGSLDFVASGDLPDGSFVILKVDGTVEVVASPDVTTYQSIPMVAPFDTEIISTVPTVVTFDPITPNKFVAAYWSTSNSNYGTLIVGIIEGSTISLGSPYVFHSGNTYNTSLAFDKSVLGKFALTFGDGNSSYAGAVKIGQIEGTAITFGEKYVYDTTSRSGMSIAHPTDENKFILLANNWNKPLEVTTFSVDDTVVTFGDLVDLSAGVNAVVYGIEPLGTLGKYIVLIKLDIDGTYTMGTMVMQVSGDTVTMGGYYSEGLPSLSSLDIAVDNVVDGRFVITYKDTPTYGGWCVVGQVTGTTVAYGTPAEFYTNASENQVIFNPNIEGQFMVGADGNGISGYYVWVGTIAGDSTITYEPRIEMMNGYTNKILTASDPHTSGRFLSFARDYYNNGQMALVQGQFEKTEPVTNLTSDGYLGTVYGDYAKGQSATIVLKGGISTGQSDLVAESTYYLQEDGTLDVTPDTVNVEVGKAISSNSINLLHLRDDVVSPKSVEDAGVYTNTQIGNIPNPNTADFVAKGTLPNGTPVVLKDDGTVEAVGDTTIYTTEAIPAGSKTTVSAGVIGETTIAVDSLTPNQCVVVYRDHGNSYYGTACVGTISGNEITFGSPIVFNSGYTSYISVLFDPSNANTFVTVYRDDNNGSRGTARVGIISNGSVTFGAEYAFHDGNTGYLVASIDPNGNGEFITAYRDYDDSSNGNAIVCQIVGDTVTFGAEYTFNTGTTADVSVAHDINTAGKFVITYQDADNSGYGTACVGTRSGTVITFGAEYVFNSGNTSINYVAFDPSTTDKFVALYLNALGDSNTVIVGTISGTTITFGTPEVFSTNGSSYMSLAFNPSGNGTFLISYDDQLNSYQGTVIEGTVSGTSVSFGTKQLFHANYIQQNALAYDTNSPGKFLVTFRDTMGGQGAAAVIGLVDSATVVKNLTSTNFLGTSTEAYTDGQTSTIMLQGGQSTNQTGLVVNSTYYVQLDGTLATAADTVSVIAGKAIGATRLLLKGI